MYFAYGFPKSYRISAEADPSEEVVYASFNNSDYLVIVTTTTVQLWSGGQQRIKLGELVRDEQSLENEGYNTRAWWCPSHRVIAVATHNGYVLFFGLHPAKEVLWQSPDGQEARRVSIYLQNSVLPHGSSDEDAYERVADLCGDSKSLLVVMENGTFLSFSWSAKLRCSASPLLSNASTFSMRNNRTSRLRNARSTSSSLPSVAALRQPSTASSEISEGEPSVGGDLTWFTEAYNHADSLPLPTPLEPQEELPLAVRSITYAPSVRLLTVTLLDGSVALLGFATGGLSEPDQARLLRWVYKPQYSAIAAVSAAVHPAGHYIAVGLAHGRVAIYSMARVLSPKRDARRSSSNASSVFGGRRTSLDSPLAVGNPSHSGISTSTNAGQPEPDHVLSLTEWGYSSNLLGAAHVVQWSPDGKVVAAGYSSRGLAVWTPSGCRVMCSLRQAAQGMAGPVKQAGDSLDASSALGNADGASLGSPSGLNPQHSVLPAADAGILERGVAALAWSQHGYSLVVLETPTIDFGSPTQHVQPPLQLLELSFAKAVHSGHRVSEARQQPGAADLPGTQDGTSDGRTGATTTPEEVFVLQAADRVLLVLESVPSSAAALHAGLLNPTEAEAMLQCQPDLTLQHVRLPQQYLDTAYPVMHVSVSPGSRDIAVAGTRGFAVYNCRAKKWRLFGDAMQERRVKAHALTWLPNGVIGVAATLDDSASHLAKPKAKGGILSSVTGGTSASAGGGGGGSAAAPALLMFPRDHLDFASLLLRHPLQQLPAAMDSIGPYLALAFPPLEISLLKVEFIESSGKLPPRAALSAVRELSILSLGGPLVELTLLAPPIMNTEEEGSGAGAAASSASTSAPLIETEEGPSHCVLLRGGGMLSVLDLHQGTESVLADQIESYWLPQSSGSRPILPAPTPLSAVGRDDSAAVIATNLVDEATSPAAKGAAWLERRTSDAAAAAAMAEELGAMAAELQQQQQQASEEPLPVEMPWWTYGARGMQLWFPSTLFDPSFGTGTNRGLYSSSSGGGGPGSPRATAGARGGANTTDPELEFDREVYPLGISLAEVSIIGVMQRTARSSAFHPSSPPALSLHPHPSSQPVLPCLLRRLLEQGRAADALELATCHSRGPHFARSLEWLLFTTLEADADVPKDVVARRVRFSSPKSLATELQPPPHGPTPPGSRNLSPMRRKALRNAAGPLLIAAARLVQQFPQSAEIVVSVARKTDAQLWPALFAAAGSPAELCEGLLSNGALQTAACCLLIVDRIEGATKAHKLALKLVRAALSAGSYGLAADLLRFLMPPGENEMTELMTPAGASIVQKSSPPAAEPSPQQQQQSRAGWLWSFFTGADKLPPTSDQSTSGYHAAPAEPTSEEESVTLRLHRAASAVSLGEADEQAMELGAAVTAWRLMGKDAWKLLDSGALRELANFAQAMANLHGGMPALLSTSASDMALSLAHTTPSAAAIASALFVASNEFAAAADGSDPAALAAAELLQATCEASGCVNHATALALILGDSVAVEKFSSEHPRVWGLLTDLVANDVHLCAFSGLMSQPGTPLVVTE